MQLERGRVNRKILHVDMDAFFVEVELLKRPDLKGQPVIVGGKSPRGVVSTCSYEARSYGIHSAMPSVHAQRLCPDAVWLDPDYRSYGHYSSKVFQILDRFSPEVVQLSIDEGRVDLTGSELLFGPVSQISDRILAAIRSELGLPASGGLSNSGTAAKIAAELAKPNGLVIMFPGYEELFLAPLKLERIPGIGKKGLPRFHSLGYKKIGDLACSTKAELCQHFGRWGGQLHQVASGKPSEIYRYVPESPSRSHERTFSQDLRDPERIRSELRHLVEKLCFKLRQEHLKSQSISVKIRDGNFNTVNRSQTFDHPVDADKIIFKAAHDLVMRNLPGQNGIRLLGVSAHQLTSTTTQLNLFQPPCDKLEQFYQAVDTIKIKYGRQAAGFGL